MSSRRRRKAPARTQSRPRPATGRDFWGTTGGEEDVVALVTAADDPSAMIASLGAPPLPGFETAAQHYFQVVYDKAAAFAVALAAANGVLHTDEDDESR